MSFYTLCTGSVALLFLFYQFCVYFPFPLVHNLDIFRLNSIYLLILLSSLPLPVYSSCQGFFSYSLSTVKRETTRMPHPFQKSTAIDMPKIVSATLKSCDNGPKDLL